MCDKTGYPPTFPSDGFEGFPSRGGFASYGTLGSPLLPTRPVGKLVFFVVPSHFISYQFSSVWLLRSFGSSSVPVSLLEFPLGILRVARFLFFHDLLVLRFTFSPSSPFLLSSPLPPPQHPPSFFVYPFFLLIPSTLFFLFFPPGFDWTWLIRFGTPPYLSSPSSGMYISTLIFLVPRSRGFN